MIEGGHGTPAAPQHRHLQSTPAAATPGMMPSFNLKSLHYIMLLASHCF